ncbi:hypothetical protein EYF80_001212 [Liparis tanakae]|uniref:Uncharacterized protein n=1 Tax=Liparis tanakae TaxID=230148 RepID=A0A4Z2JE20_9TELE|nr:hypothetical protein EYF80_001212 [Liparis tanakae]
MLLRGFGLLELRPISQVLVLDSLGGRSSLVRDITMQTGLSEVVLLIVRAIWPMRSSTQPADNRASASWSQHSSMRDTSSHSTRPMAYMSILRKESRWKLMAPSSTSGAMYRLVPTWQDKGRNNERWFGRVLQKDAFAKTTGTGDHQMTCRHAERCVLYPLGTRTRRP